jgi:uncharacterized membrane protein
MKSTKVQLVVMLLIVGLLSACASPATNTPAAQPTEVVATEAPATEAPATETVAAATDTSAPAAGETPTAGAASGGTTVSFATDIMPLIESRCINCHGGERTQEGLDMKTHASIMAGSENGAVVTPGDAANSSLAQMVLEGKMPKRGPKLTPDQVQLIVDWINQGALDN